MTYLFSGRRLTAALLGAAALGALSAGAAQACACGCGVFDVGDGAVSDSASPFTVWLRYSYMDQNQNWEGDGKAAAADNTDKKIETSFYFIGGQYRANADWKVTAELPIFNRTYVTTDDGSVFGKAGALYTAHDQALGDLQLTATYTGLAQSGLTFGFKLPTGDWRGPIGPDGGAEFDRDTLPGTGSTDLILGGYHAGTFGDLPKWSYFLQGRYEFAALIHDGYRPGNEFDGSAGVSYFLGNFGAVQGVSPMLQLVESYRQRDSGWAADPLNSGYERLLLAPALGMRIDRVRLYGQVSVPIYQNSNHASAVDIEGTDGQLVAPALFSIQASYDF